MSKIVPIAWGSMIVAFELGFVRFTKNCSLFSVIKSSVIGTVMVVDELPACITPLPLTAVKSRFEVALSPTVLKLNVTSVPIVSLNSTTKVMVPSPSLQTASVMNILVC